MKELKNIIYHTVSGKEGEENIRRNNPGNKIGKVGCGLHKFLHTHAAHLIQENRYKNGRRERKEQRQKAGSQRIAHYHNKVILKEIFKPVQPHKRRSQQIMEVAFRCGRIIGECHVQAGHRRITYKHHPDNSRKHQQKQIPLIPQPVLQRFFRRLYRSAFRHIVTPFF